MILPWGGTLLMTIWRAMVQVAVVLTVLLVVPQVVLQVVLLAEVETPPPAGSVSHTRHFLTQMNGS